MAPPGDKPVAQIGERPREHQQHDRQPPRPSEVSGEPEGRGGATEPPAIGTQEQHGVRVPQRVREAGHEGIVHVLQRLEADRSMGSQTAVREAQQPTAEPTMGIVQHDRGLAFSVSGHAPHRASNLMLALGGLEGVFDHRARPTGAKWTVHVGERMAGQPDVVSSWSGDAAWWPWVTGEGGDPADLSQPLPWEVPPPDTWAGWQRERLRPMLPRWLFPVSWALGGWVIVGVLVLSAAVGDGTPVAALVATWLTLALLPTALLAVQRGRPEADGLDVVRWLLASEAGVVAVLVGVAATLLWWGAPELDGWAEAAAWILVWFALAVPLTLWSVATARWMAAPAARWWLPHGATETDAPEHLPDGWQWLARPGWAARPLALRSDRGMTWRLEGARHAGQRWWRLTLVTPAGWGQDPWTRAPVRPFPRLAWLAPVPALSSLEARGLPPIRGATATVATGHDEAA